MAIDLYRKRKTEALQGKKLPETLRRPLVPFAEIADDAIDYIERRYAQPADEVARMHVLMEWFTNCAAESLTARDIEVRLEAARGKNHWEPSTVNHHHSLLSLTYRLAIRDGKVKENPLRGICRTKESNCRVRFLTIQEEKRLRIAIRSKPVWAEHESALDLALHTGLHRTDMYKRLL